MKKYTGRVVTGIGDCAQWIAKLEDYYFEKTGLRLFPGTLNVQLAVPFDLPSDAIRLEAEEYGGRVSISIVPCKICDLDAVILRTDANDTGDGDHPRTIVEIAAEVRLRDAYNLQDGDTVEFEIQV